MNKNKKMNFFQKIYWGWYQMGENLFEWQYRMTETDYLDADFWIALNIDLSYVLETSFWYHRDYPEALAKITSPQTVTEKPHKSS